MKNTPMKRSAFSRVGVLALSSFQRAPAKSKKSSLKKNSLKASRVRMTPIRASARNEACTLRFPCCNGDPATTVWCHSNSHKDGKGMGIKARDEEGCYGCSSCHAFLDGGYANSDFTRAIVNHFFDRARMASQHRLQERGLMPW